MSDTLKAREARLRRAAARQGLAVTKSRRRDGDAGYRIIDPETEAVVHDGVAGDCGLTIDQAEARLGDPKKSISIANLTSANDA